ncbi:microcephalin isoform X3 [Narcine bancroftii]|uniref:microcephalin isoform X3 n=1 Tax=Narcine bancroftii TaxID=1343680 RepID=UPI0038321FE4
MTSEGNKKSIFRDVVAFVDVWSSNKTENYSKSFIDNLLDMGATVLKYFNKQVTHVIFKDGHESVWNKAQKTGVKLVSVLWVERCLAMHAHVDESLFPAIKPSKCLPEHKRTHRCMKPKDFIPKTPENDKRLQKKLDQMIQELDLKRTTGADLPLLSSEGEAIDHGANVKSVPFNRFCGMEERLKKMKEKRENLSLTASQLTMEASVISPCHPTLGDSPSSVLFGEENEIDSGCASINSTSGDNHEGQIDQHSRTDPVTQGIHSIKSSQDTKIKSSLQRRKKAISEMKLQFLRRKSVPSSLSQCKTSVSSCSGKVNKNYCAESEEALNNAASDPKLNNAQSNKNEQSSPPVESMGVKNCYSKSEADFVSHEHSKSYASPLKANVSTITRQDQLNSKKKAKLCKDQFNCLTSTRNDLSEANKFHNTRQVSPIEEDRLVFEDFFFSVDLNRQKNPKSSLGVLPPKSPSPPSIIFESVKQKRKWQEIDPQNSADRNKRARSTETCNNEAANGKKPDAADARKRRKSHVKEFKDFLGKLEFGTGVIERKELHQSHEGKRLDFLSTDSALTCLSQSDNDTKISSQFCFETQTSSDQMNQKEIEEETVKCHEDDKLPKNLLKLPSDDSELDGNHQSGRRQSSLSGSRKNFHKENHNLIEVTNATIESKRKKMKPSRTLVMTSMPSGNQAIVIQIVKRLGGFLFSDSVCETTTHVIAGRPRRTLNVLFGIVQGCWILSFDWILWSLEQGCWAPEEPYELSAQFPAATFGGQQPPLKKTAEPTSLTKDKGGKTQHPTPTHQFSTATVPA